MEVPRRPRAVASEQRLTPRTPSPREIAGRLRLAGDNPFRARAYAAGAARRRGIQFVISTDAHAVADLDNVSYGVAIARRGGVRKAEVLNALPCAAFRTAVHP